MFMLAKRRLMIFLACLMALSLTVVSVGAQSTPATVSIYTSWPLTGGSQYTGVSMLNGAKLALTHYLADHNGVGPGGVTINIVPLDDASSSTGSWDGTIEAENAQRCVNDATCLVYYGTYNSGAAKVSMPITNQAGIVQVSPANSYAGLTRACGDACAAGEPDIYRPTGQVNYFRVDPTDDIQGPSDASWASCLGFQKVYIIDDQQAYGKGIADTFEAQATKIGMTVLGHGHMESADTDPRSLLTDAVAKGAQAIFGGFVTSTGGPQLIKQMSDEGLFDQGIKFIGPDGLLSPDLINQVGGADVLNDNSFFSFPSLLPNLLTDDAGVRFYTDYKSTFSQEPDPYAIYSYVGMQVILSAIDAASKTSDGVTRANVLSAVAATSNFNSLIGTFSFDKNGDNTHQVYFGYSFTDGNFANPVPISAGMETNCSGTSEATPEATASG
jgi:branched-chain amino acid transport system substrate-binding protein